MSKKEKRYLEAHQRMEYICRFAKEMGYKTRVEEYNSCVDDRPCVSIELIGTHDFEGEPFGWFWYTDTWEEFYV